jgi:hypothetical protein
MGANILVGCGGTGIETLIRLNELLSEDAYWRQRLAQQFFYILVDTEEEKLKRFQEMLHQQVGGHAKKPFVEVVSLSQGYDSLQQPVNRTFIAPFRKDTSAKAAKAKERLFEHWWQRADGEVFKAARVKPIADGAGQCPYISYFLTWNALQRVEDVFRRVINAVQARTTGANPLDNSSLIITASIAGGTGRGSWGLLAFKLRQLLAKMDKMPKPIAFLSDVSVFQNIMDRFPRQELAMRINALTGFSELSAWMENVRPDADQRPKRVEYRLPSMDKANDPEADVLQIPPHDETAFAPVDAAFLTFAESGRAFLDDNMDAHQMVGTSLYAALTRVALRGGAINDANMQYWSAAAATFEVPATTLGRYFESRACVHTLDELQHADAEAARERADEFMQANPGILATGYKELSADENGDALDRTWHYLIGESAQQWKDIENILKQQDAERAIKYVKKNTGPANRAVNAAVKSAFANVDPVKAVMDAARKFYLEPPSSSLHTEGPARRGASLGTVALFVKEIIGRVDKSLEKLKGDRFTIPPEEQLAEEIRLRSGRKYWMTGHRFEPTEISDLQEQHKRFVLSNNLELIKTKIKEQIDAWKVELNRFAAACDLFLTVCDRVRRNYQDEMYAEFETNGYDPFDQLFTNFESPAAAIPDEFDPDRFYRRDLKPVLTREQMRENLATGLLDVDFGPIDNVIEANVFDAPLTKANASRVNDLAQTLRRTIDQSVALDRTFIRKHFSIKAIITDLRNVWQAYLEKQLGRRETYESLVSKFVTFFGVEPQESNKTIQLGTSPEDFVARMGASLAARCKPYWQLDNDDQSECPITLFMPHWGGNELSKSKDSIEETIRETLAHPNTRVDVVAEEGAMANPFVMLAYSTATATDMGQIRSLDYWRENTEVKRMLESCESLEGRSLFDPRTNGVGFTDPLYVRNLDIAAMRWRPWYTGAAEEHERKGLALDALIYALLEPTAELQSKLASVKWSLPLVDIRKGKIFFVRPDLLWERGKTRENPQCPWDVDKVVEASVSKFHARLDGLNGNGAPAEGAVMRDAILAEADRFWNEVSPKIGYGPDTEQRTELLMHQQKRLSERKKSAREANRAVIERMIGRLAEKLT